MLNEMRKTVTYVKVERFKEVLFLRYLPGRKRRSMRHVIWDS
jgi:hypothetical protein